MSFTFKSPLAPDRFVGRQNALKILAERLAQKPANSIGLAGGPRTGKTSLLQYLADPKSDLKQPTIKSFCRIFFDGYTVGNSMTPGGFWAGIFKTLLAHPDTAPQQTIITKMLQKAKDDTVSVYDLEDVFDEFAKVDQLVIICIDNFDILLRNPNFWPPNDFFHIVRSLSQRNPRGLAFVIAAHRPLVDLWDPSKGASPFYNVFDNIAVGMLEENESEALLDNGFAQLGLNLDPEVKDVILRASDRHPWLINYLASACAEILQKQKPITGASLNQLFQDPDGQIVALNLQIRGMLWDPERELLKNLKTNVGKLTDPQKDYLRKLRSYGLLPPGTKI